MSVRPKSDLLDPAVAVYSGFADSLRVKAALLDRKPLALRFISSLAAGTCVLRVTPIQFSKVETFADRPVSFFVSGSPESSDAAQSVKPFFSALPSRASQ